MNVKASVTSSGGPSQSSRSSQPCVVPEYTDCYRCLAICEKCWDDEFEQKPYKRISDFNSRPVIDDKDVTLAMRCATSGCPHFVMVGDGSPYVPKDCPFMLEQTLKQDDTEEMKRSAFAFSKALAELYDNEKRMRLQAELLKNYNIGVKKSTTGTDAIGRWYINDTTDASICTSDTYNTATTYGFPVIASTSTHNKPNKS